MSRVDDRFKSLFELTEEHSDRAYVDPDEGYDPHRHRDFFLGRAVPSKPIAFRCVRGTPGDFVLAGDAVSRIVSARFATALNAAGCTGWSTFAVRLEGPCGTAEDYAGLVVTGRCGAVDPSLAERVMDKDGWPMIRGLTFPPETWDGSDVFTPAESAFVLLGERARAALLDAGLTNLHIEALADVIDYEDVFR